ncbi:dynein axonemal intermediate chain 4 isoform X3 [Hypanus sabinus]|uniref:dynein axonemal intermediate chain 4 isoform X3 n=1 Tax=Hypanus sabinus TaxID=79690 RepID=UPI0028C45A24|nr:dynein axonemal intermediate chain 4 isoform X3 [Hypanus sabinus]
MKKVAATVSLSKVGGSTKKQSVHGSIGNIGSKHSQKNSLSFLGSSSRPRISLQADKFVDKGYSAGGWHVTQIFDENGKDVTPRPLILLDPNFTQTKQSKAFTSQELSSSDYAFGGTVYQTAANVSFGGPFTRSTFDSGSVSRSSRTISESMDDIGDDGVQHEATSVQSVMATTWDLYDILKEKETHEDSSINKMKLKKNLSKPQINLDKTLTRTLSALSTLGLESRSTSSGDSESLVTVQAMEETEQDLEEIFKNEKLKQDLFFMERVIMENIFQPKLAAYRQLPIIPDPDATPNAEEEAVDTVMMLDITSPRLQPLWAFTCRLTKGHNVSCMVWNKHSLDLLAVGYGSFGYKEQNGGLICCWSLKNPMWPERIYHCESGVTALDFSSDSPNLLAVGFYDGLVAIYNVRNSENGLVLDSSNDMNKHIGPVWQLKWTEQDRNSKGDEKEGTLFSIAADGRIAKWTLAKGLESSDLMRIKRTSVQTSKKIMTDKEKKNEASISHQAPGMCFDFHPKETNIYLAGTEEGYIHKCSCSYNEQFLETYGVHKGPVYKIAWSPFSHDTFLSCSSDWSIHLWSQDIVRPVLRFTSTVTKAVHSIMWSPKSATVFGAVNEDRVEIWDLSVNILDPIIIYPATEGVRLTTILFAKNTDCILVGDTNGQVTVYQLSNMSPNEETLPVLNNIIMSTLASQLVSESRVMEEHISNICNTYD